MKEWVVASRYAKSLIELAIEDDCVDRLFANMIVVQEITTGVPRLIEVLSDERLPFSKRIKIAKEIISKAGLMKLVGDTILLLMQKGRTSILPHIAPAVLKNLRLRRKMKVACVQVADRSVAEDVRVRLDEMLSEILGMAIECEVNVDPTLMGGFVVEVGDLRFDSSVKGKLTRMKEEFFSEAKGL